MSMSNQRLSHHFPAAIHLVYPTNNDYTALPEELVVAEEKNLFYRSSINGTLTSLQHTQQQQQHTDTTTTTTTTTVLSTTSTSSSLPDISALNLGGGGGGGLESRFWFKETLSRGALGSVHRGRIEEEDRDLTSASASASSASASSASASSASASSTSASSSSTSAPSTSTSSTLVIKLVVGEDKLVLLKHEAIIYQYAKLLQGKVLPYCYGFYENEKHTAAFILLEDCGMPSGQLFETLSDKTKLEIMQALKQVHDAGLEHGDLHPWNVLNHRGSPRIVDWHLAMVHECPANKHIMTEEFCCREGISELACEELVAVGDRMSFPSQDQIWCG